MYTTKNDSSHKDGSGRAVAWYIKELGWTPYSRVYGFQFSEFWGDVGISSVA
jgi:hypothetical protein